MLHFLEINKDLIKYSSFRTPAIARYFFELGDKNDLHKLHDIWKFAKIQNLAIIFIGSWTNTVFAFDMFEGIVVHNKIKGIEWWENTVQVGGWELISPLSVQVSKRKENSLFTKWIWLPGTTGGAVAGNAGCFGFETKDALVEVTIFDMASDEIKTISMPELEFGYRHSLLKEKIHWFVVDMIFRTDLISNDTTDPRTFRSGKQPTGFTCGSFFRNPPWDSAGRLIDQAGLKWYRIGGVKISEIHANFFVNDENGSYHDILALRDTAKEKVQKMFGIGLHEEARIIENK